MRRLRKRGLLVGVLAVGLAGAAFAVWPRGPQLELYTSPAAEFEGRTVRVQVLKPLGWVAERLVTYEAPRTMVETGDGHTMRPMRSFFLTLHPAPPDGRLGWMPGWLRRYFVREPEGELTLSVDNDGAALATPVRVVEDPSGGDGTWSASQRVKIGAVGATIEYVRNRKDEFEGTYGPVCGSFRVIAD